MNYLQSIVSMQKQGKPAGIYSACSSNPYVLKAVLQRARDTGTVALIESTANQVNQFGGYSGMTPADFHAYVLELAKEVGLDASRLILGGDHLGPLTWTDLPEDAAMRHAEVLIADYVKAGFTKIHIDTSMRLGSDDPGKPLSDETISGRGARLCRVSEDAYKDLLKHSPGAPAPMYIIGSEVPIPGGAQEKEESIFVTNPEDCLATVESFHASFIKSGLSEAWKRVIGVVVQPGVEFGNDQVFDYDSAAASALTNAVRALPVVIEGHSTDYQTRGALKAMVEDGIAILKVGPGLTFALREGLYALEKMEAELLEGSGLPMSNLAQTLEQAMLDSPGQWQKHYHGSGQELRYMRKYSYSDRARYYLSKPVVQDAVGRLIHNLDSIDIPMTIVSQYLPSQYKKCREGLLPVHAVDLLCDRVGDVIDDYLYATGVIGTAAN